MTGPFRKACFALTLLHRTVYVCFPWWDVSLGGSLGGMCAELILDSLEDGSRSMSLTRLVARNVCPRVMQCQLVAG